MRKLLLLAVGLFGFETAQAQFVTLNVKLNPIQTLVVNQNQRNVDLQYVTQDDYANGVSSLNPDHLTIYSTGGFQVRVKSSNATLQNNGKQINVNSIQVKASAGSNALQNAQYEQNAFLSSNDVTLITSTHGGVNKNINIEYKGAGGNQYIDNYISGQTPTIYTAELTYTIISQ